MVTCVYVNPTLDLFWLIDYRIYDPDGDGKSKLDHVHERLTNVVYHKQLPFQAVLMDTWYAHQRPHVVHRVVPKVLLLPPQGQPPGG